MIDADLCSMVEGSRHRVVRAVRAGERSVDGATPDCSSRADWGFSGGGLSAVGPAGLHNPSRPPTHPPAPSRKSPLPPRAGHQRRAAQECPPCGPHRSRCRSLWGGFISTSPRRDCSETRVLSSPTPTQPVRVHPASELGQAEVALRSRQEPAHCLSGRQAASLGRPWRSATREARRQPGRCP